MKLADYLDRDAIDAELACADRDDALRRVSEMLHASGAVTDPAEAARRLVYREEVMSTSIEPGVAFPHALSEAASRSAVSVCRCPTGVDFRAPSGEPVRLVFTLIGPADARAIHVKLLARIARLLKRSGAKDELLAADTPEAMLAVLERLDNGSA